MDTAKNYANIPISIKQLHQWVAQKQKRPINPRTGAGAKSNDPSTWATFSEAVEAVTRYSLDGIGIMFGNGLCGVDIDHCVDNGTMSPLAADIIQLMNSYTEVSPSGTGVHILFTGAIEKSADLYTKNPGNGVEMYSSERYFTVTGNALGDPLPVNERREAIKQVQDKYMRRSKQDKAPANAYPTSTPPTLSDEEILAKAKTAANADDFIKLWSGDTSAHGGDDSAADLALCNILAFWSGRNADTIDRLFRQSGLFRSKWERKQSGTTYGAITVQKAIATCSNIYQPNSGLYVVENGCVYRKTGQNEKKYLANFSAYPLEDVEKDNGTEKSRYFTIGGKRSSGIPLPTVSISAEQFPALNWISKHWGMYPRVAPGNGNKDYFRDYIQSQAEGIPCKTLYTHTGFRKINDKLCFLYHGGALGTDNIECELEGDLSRYTFLTSQAVTERDALDEVLQLFHLTPPEISYPLLAFTYLAPLNYFLEKAGIAPAFCLFNIGETGSFKTVMSMLYLAHFRAYNGMSETPPTNFHSTSNAIEKMSFDLKDVPLLIDDYHPTNTADKKRMDGIAQRLARGAGDHSSRARMNSDTSLKASYAPRGLSMVTGEDTPDIGQSGLARYYFVKFSKGLIDTDALTQRQNNAQLLNAAMQGYIKWLMANADDIQADLKGQYFAQMKMVNIAGSHSRTGPIISWLQLGVLLFTQYACSAGAISEADGQKFCSDAWGVFIKEGEYQARTQQEETPTTKFLTTLEEILATERMVTEGIDSLAKDAVQPERRLGYHDADYYYLFPDPAYNAVCEVLRGGGTDFPVSKRRLFADLAKGGYILVKGNSTTPHKRVRNTSPRCLYLKKSALDGLKEFEENEQ